MGFISILGLVATWALKGIQVIFKIAVFLLLKLGMWLSALYALGWLLICTSREIPLSDPAAIRVLWIGCIVAAAVGMIATNIYQEYRRRVKKFGTSSPGFSERDRSPRIKKRDRTDDSGDTEDDYARGYRDARREFGHEREINEIKEIQETAAEPRQEPNPQSRTGFEPVPDRFKERRNPIARSRSPELPSEQPLIFATRKDPDIIIVEYSDRLVYYRKRPDGGEPELITTEFKTGY